LTDPPFTARSRALGAAFALRLCLEEGAARCPLLVCPNPCLGSLVVSSCSSSLRGVGDMSRAAPCVKWQALDRASVAGGVGSHPAVGHSTRTPLAHRVLGCSQSRGSGGCQRAGLAACWWVWKPTQPLFLLPVSHERHKDR